jgi:hypothetical protein
LHLLCSSSAISDGFPFLVVSSSSATDLERQILEGGRVASGKARPGDEEILSKWEAGEGDIIRRTRGNLVIGCGGGQAGKGKGMPWDEDNWGVLEIGEEKGEFVMISKCIRCLVRPFSSFLLTFPRPTRLTCSLFTSSPTAPECRPVHCHLPSFPSLQDPIQDQTCRSGVFPRRMLWDQRRPKSFKGSVEGGRRGEDREAERMGKEGGVALRHRLNALVFTRLNRRYRRQELYACICR